MPFTSDAAAPSCEQREAARRWVYAKHEALQETLVPEIFTNNDGKPGKPDLNAINQFIASTNVQATIMHLTGREDTVGQTTVVAVAPHHDITVEEYAKAFGRYQRKADALNTQGKPRSEYPPNPPVYRPATHSAVIDIDEQGAVGSG